MVGGVHWPDQRRTGLGEYWVHGSDSRVDGETGLVWPHGSNLLRKGSGLHHQPQHMSDHGDQLPAVGVAERSINQINSDFDYKREVLEALGEVIINRSWE
ncbi:hypothetical protein Y1Q_0011846 [Alligator mississippiensis]|uniref:Uncharacterized protein n=1 Tax=Alligator mississippiensis TaxID=8496 RepID=A0A151MYT3_ALLMI|nr:hypothetical protein Y1Q_0011846 [Alligator mississippiensis]